MSATAYTIIIATALLLEFFLEESADFLNLRKMQKGFPQNIAEEFKDFDKTTQEKSFAYARTRTLFSGLSSLVSLVLLFGFWFAHGFGFLDNLLRTWLADTWADAEIISGLLYLSVLFFLRSLISLPFNIYSTFVIEEKFGFNKTNVKTFVLDILKGLLLALLIGLPLVAALLAFFQYAGSWAWAYAWLLVVLWGLFLQYISPTFIMPLFNKFTPMPEGSLKEKIRLYAQANQFVLQDIYVMDGSRRSAKANAFFTGFGKHRRIALFDTLIADHSEKELVAVLAHEIGHYKKKHILKDMIFSALHTGILFYLLSFFLTQENLFAAFFTEQVSVYAGLIFFSLLYSPVELLLSLVQNIFSRAHEFEADRFAKETTGAGENLVQALKGLAKNNLSNLNPHPFYVFLHYSHPPLMQRIAALRS